MKKRVHNCWDKTRLPDLDCNHACENQLSPGDSNGAFALAAKNWPLAKYMYSESPVSAPTARSRRLCATHGSE